MSKFRFARDENGSILVFVMVVFSAMALVGGTAVDLARHETLRASLQYNMDRAVIAAASLKQTQSPTAVVNDYMSKVYTIEDFTIVVNSSVATNARTVTATANTNLDTWFLSMAGVSEMPIRTISTASEHIPNLEISLVLDISGSMADNSKIVNLKSAAKAFVSQMLTDATPGQVSISLVPFSTSVAPSQGIYDALNVSEKHKLSRCVDFDDAAFSSMKIDPTEALEQTILTAPYGNWGAFQNTWESCITDTYHEIMPYSQSISALHARIDSMVAYSGTSGHLGAKWGAALLDPAFQPVVTSLIADGTVSEDFSDLPVSYSEVETLKVMVIMGDGQNSKNYRFDTPSAYRGDNSDVWLVKAKSTFSHLTLYGKDYSGSAYETYCSADNITCHYDSPTTYFIKKPGVGKYYNALSGGWITTEQFDDLTLLPEFESRERLSWEEAWSFMPVSHYDSIVGGSSAMNAFSGENFTDTAKENTLMLNSCGAAKSSGVVVYSIGFEIEAEGVAEKTLRDCASTHSHYQEATGSGISTAFLAIAGSIRKLRLTH